MTSLSPRVRARRSRTTVAAAVMVVATVLVGAHAPVAGATVRARRPARPRLALPTRVVGTQRLAPAPAPLLASVPFGAAEADVTFHEMADTSAGGGTAGPGDTLRSDPTGTKAAGTNVVFTVTTPKGGAVAFTKNGGKSVLGHRKLGGGDITAPDGTADSPLKITMAVDISTLPASMPIGAVAVLRNEDVAGECTNARIAAPDPCIAKRERNGNELTITVLSSKASTWTATRPYVERVFGDTRITTAIAASRMAFVDQGASAVVLIRSDLFADALPAAPLAVVKKAPVLLTAGATLDDLTLAEITRVLPLGKTVYLLGGVNALSDAVADRLVNWGYVPVRYFGANRYETAVVVARDGLGSPSVAILANGNDYGDALPAGAAAAKAGGAVLLTNGDTMPPTVASYLDGKKPTRYAIGAPAIKADPTATKLLGADRYETAVLVAKKFFNNPATIGIVSGTAFPDALAGGGHVGATGGPMLAVPQTGALPPSIKIYLTPATSPPQMFLYGGTAAVAPDVATQLRRELIGA